MFAYPVTATDKDNHGISIDADALELNGGAIHKQGDASTAASLNHGTLSTQSGHRVNQADAFIVSGGVSVISTPRAATDTYGAGEVIEIQVVFNEAVNATAGTDFVISVSGRKRAALLRGNGTDTLVFGYTVQAADSDGNGIWIGPQDRTLVGNRGGDAQTGLITSAATDDAAVLTHAEVGTLSGHKVDGSLTPPASTDATLSALSVTGGGSELVTNFASDTYAYTASVASSVDEVTFAATTNHGEATVRYLKGTDVLTDADSTDDGFQVELDEGANAITVEVTAEDTTTTQTYTVTVTRAAGATAPVWSATMTAGDTKVGHGYDATDTPAVGTLDDDDFVYESLPHTVLAIDVGNVVRFVVEGGLPMQEALTLEFGGHALAFSDRISVISINQSRVWNVPDALDDLATEFPVGSTATVCLRTATQVCPAGRIVTPSKPTLSIADAAGTEGGNVTFTATLSATAAADVTATWTASIGSGDTAADADLGTTKTGTVTVTANQPSGTFDVPTAPDTDNEADETFTVTLSGVSTNAELAADPTATGTITNDDAPGAPADFRAGVGDAQVELSWDAPAPGANITRHEVRRKEGSGSYPTAFTPIPMSAPGGANEKRYTVTGLTNEVAYTFELRAVNDAGGGTAAEAGPVTPTPGICGRTQQVRDAILDEVTGVTDCNEVTVANLAAITGTLDLEDEGITSLQSGDFAGLTALDRLYLPDNDFSSLPLGVFSGLTGLTRLYLHDNDDLTSLPDGVFADLTALENIRLFGTGLTSLPDGAFDGLTVLESLRLHNNQLTSLPDEVFQDLTALTSLTLNDNDLDALPDGVFTGLTALDTLSLDNNPNSGDDLPLTVTVEKVGTDQARAKVAAGAPFAVDFTPTVANGSLPASDTKLAVAAGSVDGTAETVTRTSGTTAAVTVDIDLSTQPTLPTKHSGYAFAKATGSEPTEILSAETALPALSIGNASATEGSLIRFPLTLSAAPGEIVSVQCNASFETGDTAAAADLTRDTSTATIQAGSTSGSCAISSAQDTIDEENETFTVTLSNPSSNAQLASDPTAKGTINDDDDPPTVSVEDVSAEEGTALTFTVALSAASGKTVTVDWAASAETGDTATAGTDFTAVAATTLTFDAGQEEKTVTVQTTEDSADEDDETFTVTLSSPSNATLSTTDATAKGTIEDDDGTMMPMTPADVLVSNYPADSPSNFSLTFSPSGASQRHYIAETFTAGAGFVLTAVDIPFRRVPDNARVTVTLHARDGSKPGTFLANLDLSGALAAGDNTYVAPAGTALAAGTYFVRLRWRMGDTDNLIMTDGPDAETSAESGWSIEDRTQFSASGSSWSNWNQQFAMRVRGTINAEPRVATRGVRIESDPAAHDSYAAGEDIEVAVGFTDDVTVDTAGGTPRIALTVGSDTRYADYSAGDSDADELAFVYTVTAADHDQDGVSIAADALELNGGAIHMDGDSSTDAVLDHAALDADSDHRVNRDPIIVADGVSVISTPLAATDTYGRGEVIEIEVRFSAAVDATSGTDFVLSVAGPRRAPLLRGSGTNKLVFGYTVAPGDADDSGIWIGDQDRTLVGNRNGDPQNGAITSAVTDRAADLDHDEPGTLSGHKVNGAVVAPVMDARLSALSLGTGVTLSPTFAPDTTAYTATVANSVEEVTVAPATNHADATYKYLDASDTELVDADTNAAGFQVAVAVGDTVFKVQVTAEDGTTTQTYTVTVTRQAMAPPHPQTDVLVSNNGFGIAATNGITVGSYQVATMFTAGDNPQGYELDSATITVAAANTVAGAASLAIHEASGSNPGTKLFDLTGNVASAGASTWDAPADSVLEMDTNYFLVVSSNSAGDDFSFAVTEDDGQSGLNQWSIANSSRQTNIHGGFADLAGSLVMTLTGREIVGDDATLSALSLGAGVTLSPTFASGTTTYTASVANGVDEVTVTPTTTDPEATYEYLDSSDSALADADTNTAGHQVALSVGDTVFKVKVTAEDGTTTQTYTVTVTQAAGATMPTLSIADASGAEDAGVEFTATLTAGVSAKVTATWTASIESGDTAVAADLATTKTGDVEFEADAETTTFTVPVTDDSTDEEDETFTVTLSGVSSNAQLASDPTAKGTIVDDDTAPTVTDVSVTSTPVLETDTYGAGETILFTVTLSEAVTVTGDPEFAFSLDTGEDRAAYKSGSGTTALVFGYTVLAADEDEDGIFLLDGSDFNNRDGAVTLDSDDAIKAAGSTTDADLAHTGRGTESGHKVDGTRSIVSVAVTSTPQLETDTYGAGETIEFTVTFNVAVDVTGDPVVEFLLDGSEVRQAGFLSGSGSTGLVFHYLVVSGDDDDNGLFIRDESDYNNPDGPIRLDSNDEIKFKDTSTDVPLYWAGRGTQSGHKVDGSRTTGNVAPSFTSSATFDNVAENQTAVGTVVAADSDSDDSVTGYEIAGGADQGAFSIGATSGVLTFNSAPNFEAPSDTDTNGSYVVTVQATSGTGPREMTADQTITVTVTDADEQSAKPDKPELEAVSGSSTSLTATWETPDKNGGPAITGYKLEYKLSTETSWTAFAHTGTAVTATVTGLTADTAYQARVRAENGETDSDWSDASDAVSTNAETVTPTCTLNPGDLWCGVVTVGAIMISGTHFADGFNSSTGGLSDTTFTVGTNNYTIDTIGVGATVAAGSLNFSLTSALTATDRAKLVLHVGSRSFALSDSGDPGASFSYDWPTAGLDWTSETSVTLRLRANSAPVFADDLVAITLPENSAVGTSVGAAVTATDADDDTLTYSLEGTDAASFDIESGTGQIKTKSGVTYDFEATQNTYEMTVKADDGNGGTDTIEVNIALLDADEKSAKPDKPTLAAVSGSSTSLTATWEKPDLNGGPDITGYDLQYRAAPAGTWMDFEHSDTAVTATITGLTADTSYQARVLAKNGETDSDWSDASDAVSTNAETADPMCTLDTAAGDIWCGVLTVGAVSSNQDGFFGSTGGLTDTTFSVGSSNYMIEQLTVESPTSTNAGDLLLGLGRDRVLSAANRARLVLHVDDSGDMFAFNATAASGFSHLWTGTDLDWSSATTVTLRLRLTPEVPGKPTNLMAEADGSTRIALSWEAPADDGGSEITGYRIEVSDDAGSNWDDLVDDTGNDDTTYTHTGLSAGDTRHYRVSAINAEGTSDASAVADATTAAAGTCTLNPGDIWCGVVTVERFSIPPLPLYGFGAGKGGLSDPDFTYGSNSYTIDVAANELNNELLYFSLTSSLTAGDRAALELHVDGSSASFAFSAANYNSSTHTYTWTGTGLNWFVTPTVTLRLRTTNTAPVFADDLVAITLPENSAVGTSVGAAVTATDADSDTLTYSLEGTDAASFDIESGTGQIKTKSGVTYDFEATQNTYEMTVKAADGNGGTDTIDVNIALLDDDTEKSAKPAKPTLAAVSGSSTTLTATWTKPGLNGGPDITGYKLEYREGSGNWQNFAHSGTGVTATLTGLTANTEYQVRVRAENGETDSDWSDPSDAVRTNAVDIPIPPGLDVTLHLSDDEPFEDLLAVTVTATVSLATPVPFTVEISASPVAPATDDDFELSTNRTLSFAANETGSTGTVRISPVADEDPEPNDVVTVSGAVSNPAIPNPDAVRLTILNDDADLPQDIAIDAPAAVDEGAGTVDVTVTMTTRQNTAPVIDAQLFYRQRPGTATRGDDYTRPQGLGNRIAIVPISAFSANAAGTAWVARHSFEIGIVDDGEAERDETIVFEIYSISDNRGTEQTIVIRDDDATELRNVTVVNGPGADGWSARGAGRARGALQLSGGGGVAGGLLVLQRRRHVQAVGAVRVGGLPRRRASGVRQIPVDAAGAV